MTRVLVADDEEGIRSFVAESLELEGHEVLQAADGASALAMLEAAAFDVLVTDLKMPGLDGMELVRRLRASQPDLAIVVLTAHGTVEVAVEAMKLGARDFIEKPISSLAQLRLVVARAAEHRALALGRERESRDRSAARISFGDPATEALERAIGKVAPTAASVLLLGESGTGKTLAARVIHERSQVADGPFVAVNCAAIPESLLESELFGHEKGAFTGAHAQHRGRVELAEGGTLFLDEIGELDPRLQAKLLRVLEERAFERVGGTRTLRARVRWIAATNRDLTEAVAARRFREDLYHRIAVFPLRMPALRERALDILPLAELLLGDVARELGRARLTLSAEAQAAIRAHPWPGNVRELRNALERGAILATRDVVDRESLGLDALGADALHIDDDDAAATAGAPTLEALEKGAIQRALEAHGGHRRKAAAALGIGLRTLYEKLRRYGLS